MMRKSKCRFCVDGIVLDKDCDKIIGHCYCDIDQYDEEIGCNPSCHGYSAAKVEIESEAK